LHDNSNENIALIVSVHIISAGSSSARKRWVVKYFAGCKGEGVEHGEEASFYSGNKEKVG
jgi:hypothetical protein